MTHPSGQGRGTGVSVKKSKLTVPGSGGSHCHGCTFSSENTLSGILPQTFGACLRHPVLGKAEVVRRIRWRDKSAGGCSCQQIGDTGAVRDPGPNPGGVVLGGRSSKYRSSSHFDTDHGGLHLAVRTVNLPDIVSHCRIIAKLAVTSLVLAPPVPNSPRTNFRLPDHRGAIALTGDRHSTIWPRSGLLVGNNTARDSQRSLARASSLSIAISVSREGSSAGALSVGTRVIT